MDKNMGMELRRDELFDYLRNLQRLAEARSKVNGTTAWILLVAIGYFANWFANRLAEPEFQTNFLIGLSIALLFFFWVFLGSSPSIRLNTGKARLITLADSSSLQRLPFNVLKLTVLFLPLVASYIVFGLTIPVVFSSVFAITAVIFYVVVPIVKVFRERPLLRLLDSDNQMVIALVSIGALICMALHVSSLADVLHSLDSQAIVFVGHAAAFWLVVINFFGFVSVSEATSRYMKLEESLVFGLASSEEILRKLEAESLGVSLEEELESREKLIVTNQQKYEQEMATFKSLVEQISAIPAEYESERLSRIEKAYTPVMKAFTELTAAFDEEIDFIRSILRAGRVNVHENARQILERDIQRIKEQHKRLAASTKEMFAETRRVLNVDKLGGADLSE